MIGPDFNTENSYSAKAVSENHGRAFSVAHKEDAMDQKLAARIFSEGEIIEQNTDEDLPSPGRIWPRTIDGRWLYPGEYVIEFEGQRYVVSMPQPAKRKDLP